MSASDPKQTLQNRLSRALETEHLGIHVEGRKSGNVMGGASMRLLKGVLCLVLVSLVVLVAAFAWGRWRPPTAEEEKAFAELSKDRRPASGRNAYPSLWFLGFDVPVDQADLAYGALHQRLLAWMASDGTRASHGDPRTLLMPDASPLPRVTSDEWDALCRGRGDDCLAKVQAHLEQARSLLSRHAPLLDQEKNLINFDYVWSDLPGVPWLPVDPFGFTTGLWQTSIAADFAEGRQTEAMDAVCTQVAVMRRLHAGTNSLMASGTFVGHTHGSVHLFAQLLSKFPMNQALPASCATAFAPIRAEDVDMCPSMQEQFKEYSAIPWNPVRWYDRLTLSKEQTYRLYAVAYGAMCDPELPGKLLTDEPVDGLYTVPQADVFDRVSNRDGVRHARIPAYTFSQNLEEQQDFAATLRMGALLMWLRETRGQDVPLQQRIRQRPDWMRFADDRKLGLDAGSRALTFEPRTHNIKPWMTSWPLPQGL